MITGASGPRPDLVAALLGALPQWFGDPDANARYVRDAETMPALYARDDDGRDIGVLLYRHTQPGVVDIHLLAVAPDRHRRGVGHALLGVLDEVAHNAGAHTVTVATLGASDPHPDYAATRAFYEAEGFVGVEERTDVWPGNPRLLMVRSSSDVAFGSFVSVGTSGFDTVTFETAGSVIDSGGGDYRSGTSVQYGLPLVRTDFSDDAAWQTVLQRVKAGFAEFDLDFEDVPVPLIDDRSLAGFTIEDVVLDLERRGGFKYSSDCIALADAETFASPAHLLLVVSLDADEEPGTFRTAPEELVSIEANLSLPNLDFADFARGAEGGYLGQPEADTARQFTEAVPNADGWPRIPFVEEARQRGPDAPATWQLEPPALPPGRTYLDPPAWIVTTDGPDSSRRLAGPFAAYREAALFTAALHSVGQHQTQIVALEFGVDEASFAD